MLDIGWSELLVIAVVLIVVVGPKDLPPMIRAFGKTMAGLRKMAGDFRSQFDEALKEADMDDVRQTISDVRNLNPTNSLRDAMNPLRQLGNEIRSDLQEATTPPASPATSAPAGAPAVSVPEPEMKLPDGPPVVAATPAPVAAAAVASVSEKPKRTRKVASEKSVQDIEAETVAAKPKRAAKTVSAKTDAGKPVAAMTSEPAALTEVAVKVAKAKPVKVAAEKPKPAARKSAAAKVEMVAPAKRVKTAKAKKDEA